MPRRPDSRTRHPEVVAAIRQHGLAFRDQIATRTGLSTATVARAVSDLAAAGLVRERADRSRTGSVGRPSVPVSLDDERYVVVGVHLGRRVVTVSLTGIDGTVLAVSTIEAPQHGVDELVAAVVTRTRSMLDRVPARRALALGIVAPWRDIEYTLEQVVDRLSRATELPVEAADHIQAIAAAEFAGGRRRPADGVTLYVYARDTVGFAVVWDGTLAHHDASRVGRLAHLPTGSTARCPCGAEGCLEATVSDQSLAARAYDDGVIDEPEIGALLSAARNGHPDAHRRLVTRGEVLGRSAAVLRDMLNPDRMILAGQAFTGYEESLDEVVAGFTRTTTLPAIDLTFTRFGAGVQAIAAGTTALRPVDRDPMGCLRRHLERTRHPIVAVS